MIRMSEVLAVALALSPATTVANSDEEQESSGKVGKYILAGGAIAVAVAGGAGAVRVVKKIKLNKLLKEKQTLETVGLSERRLPKDLWGIFSAEKIIEQKGLERRFVGDGRRFFARGHTPSDQLLQHLASFDEQALKQGIAIDRDLVSKLPFAKDLSVSETARFIESDRKFVRYPLEYVADKWRFFARDHTPSDQLSQHLESFVQQTLKQGVAIDENFVSKLAFTDDLSLAEAVEFIRKQDLTVISISISKEGDFYETTEYKFVPRKVDGKWRLFKEKFFYGHRPHKSSSSMPKNGYDHNSYRNYDDPALWGAGALLIDNVNNNVDDNVDVVIDFIF